MNAKTLEAVKRHGESLLLAFPNCTEKDPVALCKKLRRIETSIAPILLRNCNEGVPDEEMDAATDKAKTRACALLGLQPDVGDGLSLRINRDPRGYALKMEPGWVTLLREKRGLGFYQDWGGYGILAPDLTA